MAKILHIQVTDCVATYQKRDGVIVCGNTDYEIAFTFDSEWAEHSEKRARFIYNGKHTDVVFTGDTCPVPMMRGVELLSVGVYAGELRTTTPAEIPCRLSVLCKGGTLAEPDAHYTTAAELAAQEAAESAETARQLAQTAQGLEATVARNSKRIANLEQGIEPDPFHEDDAEAYSKTVPANALPFAELTVIGGATYRDAAAQTLTDTRVTAVKIGEQNLFDPSNYTLGALSVGNMAFTPEVKDSGISFDTWSGARGGAGFIFPAAPGSQVSIKWDIVKGSYNPDIQMAESVGTDGVVAGATNTGISTQNVTSASFTQAAGKHYVLFMLYCVGGYKAATITNLRVKTNGVEVGSGPNGTLPIPADVQALDGYGQGIPGTAYYNHIGVDEDGRAIYAKKVKKVKLQNVGGWFIAGGYFKTTLADLSTVSTGDEGAGLCDAYPENTKQVGRYNGVDYNEIDDKSFYIKSTWFGARALLFRDDSIAPGGTDEERLATWKKHLADKSVTLVYSLATPVVTDISTYMTEDNLVEVEPSGTITMVNEGARAVPSTITYMLKGE